MNSPSSEPPADARAWVDVDLAALVRNARRVAAASGAPLLPMVKANGYGLGAVAVARALEAEEPWGYGVATIEEGRELREAGISRPILLFTPMLAPWIAAAVGANLTPVVCDLEALRGWMAAAPGRAFHLGIDTGMARAGFSHDDRAALAAARDLVADSPLYEGICTHFHSAESDPQTTAQQWERLLAVRRGLGGTPRFVHAANSAAALEGRRYAGDLVRPGIFLYGGDAGHAKPEPVAAFRARVVGVRAIDAGATVSYGATWRAPGPTTVATLAAGYADGVPRSLGGTAVVELDQRRVPIRGRVTMDMTMVETHGRVRAGEIATIYGGAVSIEEQAAAAGTIAYELLTRLSSRVPRRYT